MRDALRVTPTLDAETRARVSRLVLKAQRTLPHLSLTITPHTDGKQWLVDHCCSRAWVYAHLAPDPLIGAVRAALAELGAGTTARRGAVPAQRDHSPVMAT